MSENFNKNQSEITVMDMQLCVNYICSHTGIDKNIVKAVLSAETDYWMELDPSN